MKADVGHISHLEIHERIAAAFVGRYDKNILTGSSYEKDNFQEE